jgi:hypothetical protein
MPGPPSIGSTCTLIKGFAKTPASSGEGVGVPLPTRPPLPIHDPNSTASRPHITTIAPKMAVDAFHNRSSARAGS